MRKHHVATVVCALVLQTVYTRAFVFASLSQQPTPTSQPSTEPWQSPDVYAPGASGLTSPRIVKEVKANYTGEAMRARIQGTVKLECIVERDGTVGPVRVVESLDATSGLDDQAVGSLKQWRFLPGMKDGAPVRMLVGVEISFSLGTPAPGLAWPQAFGIKPDEREAARDNWVDDVVSTPDVTIRFAYPPGWILAKGEHPTRLLLLQKYRDARACSVSRPKPSTLRLTAPLSGREFSALANRLRQTTSADPEAQVLGIGQVQIQGRLWIWTELSRRTIDLSVLPPEAAAEIREAFEGMRSWEFATTEGLQGITVSCYVLKPRGASDGELQEQLRRDGADFAAILNRISISPQ